MSIRHLNSHVTVRAYNKTVDVGYIMDSRKARTTEIDALLRMHYGDPYPATDTIGEALRAGKFRCPRCCQFKEPASFTSYRKEGYEKLYRRTYCKACYAEMERTKRFERITPLEVYPRRIG